MGSNKPSIFLLILLCGCTTASPEQKSVYEQGYRTGVQEQMRQIAASFQGGNFPYYHWTKPMVQQVQMPAHVANGVFIPEHQELVIIKPGEWAMSPSYPISAQDKETYVEREPEDMDVFDISDLPDDFSQGPELKSDRK